MVFQGTLVYAKTDNFDSAGSFFDIDSANGTIYTVRDIALDGLYTTTYRVWLISSVEEIS